MRIRLSILIPIQIQIQILPQVLQLYNLQFFFFSFTIVEKSE